MTTYESRRNVKRLLALILTIALVLLTNLAISYASKTPVMELQSSQQPTLLTTLEPIPLPPPPPSPLATLEPIPLPPPPPSPLAALEPIPLPPLPAQP